MEYMTCTLREVETETARERAEVERRGALGLPLDDAALKELEDQLRSRRDTKAAEEALCQETLEKARKACRLLLEVGAEVKAIRETHCAGPNRPDLLDWGVAAPFMSHVDNAVGVAASLLNGGPAPAPRCGRGCARDGDSRPARSSRRHRRRRAR